MAVYEMDGSYGIEVERDGRTMQLMEVIDGGDPLGENLLACPYLNINRETVEAYEDYLTDFKNGENLNCFFWEVEGDEEESRRNFDEACCHYHDLYGVRGCIFDD